MLAGRRTSLHERHVRGQIVTVDRSGLTVKLADGHAVRLELTNDTRVATVSRADLAGVGQNDYVGTTAVPQAGGNALRALEVHIFPDSMRGTGEGHRAWDLTAGSSMTNGTVAGVARASAGQSSMTNGTVARVSKGAGEETLAITYPKGEEDVIVPAGTPVVRLAPADRSRLAPGAWVFAAGPSRPDGTVMAGRVFVGEGGVVPPM
jgi:hypothetical protein